MYVINRHTPYDRNNPDFWMKCYYHCIWSTSPLIIAGLVLNKKVQRNTASKFAIYLGCPGPWPWTITKCTVINPSKFLKNGTCKILKCFAGHFCSAQALKLLRVQYIRHLLDSILTKLGCLKKVKVYVVGVYATLFFKKCHSDMNE